MGSLALEVVEDGFEFGCRLRVGDAGLEASHQRKVSLALNLMVIGHVDGQIHISAPPQESRRHDSDYGAGMTVECEDASEDAGITAEVRFPIAITEERHFPHFGTHVALSRSAAQQRKDPKHSKGVACNLVAAQTLRLERSRQRNITDRGSDDAIEDVCLVGDLFESRRIV